MRIRKRQVPLSSLSDLNDATTTSPNLSCTHATATTLLSLSDHPQPFDQLLPPIRKQTNGCDDSLSEERQKQEFSVEDGRGQEKERGQNGNDTRKVSILSAQISTSSPSSYKQDWISNKGEKAFPLNKRRGIVVNDRSDDHNSIKKMKRKKCYDSSNEEVVVRETKQKKVRGGALMEGSRCSRINGRGWRCCQPTLVGYSLCEHHLGKGRLRSMTSVRNRSLAAAVKSSIAPKNNNLQDMNIEPPSIEKETKFGCNKDNEEKKPLMVTKKRMKLGMVKARSMSSLLGQTNNDIAIAENNKSTNHIMLVQK